MRVVINHRVVLKTPGAEKAQQWFALSRSQADMLLDLALAAGQPEGTEYGIYEMTEQTVVSGIVEAKAL